MRGPINPMRTAVTPVHLRPGAPHLGMHGGMPQPGINVIGGSFAVPLGYTPNHSPIRRPRSMFKSDYCSTRKFLFFFICLVVDCIDIGANWWIYQVVRDHKVGLVFGSFSENIVLSFYAFSIIGTILSILESLNLLSFACKWYFINPDIALAISLWFEDIPQLGLNVSLVYCRERPVTRAQFTRAVCGIIVVIFKLLVVLSRHCACCGKKFLKYSHTDINERCAWRSRLLSSIVLVGFALALAEASYVFKYTRYNEDNFRETPLNIPKPIVDGRWDANRYFSDVSVYFSPPPFHPHIKMATQPHSEWIRIGTVYEFMGSKSINFDYSFTDAGPNGEPAILAFKQGFRSECYIVEPYTMNFNWSDMCLERVNETIHSVHFVFKYHMDAFTTMGQIYYNYAFCQSPRFGASKTKSSRQFRIRPFYFQTQTRSKWSSFLASRKSRVPKWIFYDRYIHMMQDVNDIWRTGYLNCPPTGTTAPVLDNSIRLNCTEIL
ncbi:uncharacterized protein LOC106878068 [Octopus bimaculoides]|uniref:Uncharacterized protein n=1 Tax=Octopus bimaculoides TaxID=37653 RepID=A0A0L8GAP4_OCTBM|nr:uncharacterized protein LOC106878068 [Octopus bimaculoides]|eukprot:XP_014782647.1 PREDICTED: uncharacterized protein LOC106878068 [Octopus bimaculoides]